MKKVVILGSTSTMIQPLLRMMAREGMELLLVARSQERLDALRSDLLARGASNVVTYEADLTSSPDMVYSFAKECFRDFDTLLLSYGTMLDQERCEADVEYALNELQTNFLSAVALLTTFAKYFRARRSGTIAVITSVAGDRGRKSNYVYGSAKAGLSTFLQGLRCRMHEYGVRVLTIKPGPVETAMTERLSKPPLTVMPEVVAADVFQALENSRREVIYTPKRWRWIMSGIRFVPETIFKRLSI